MKVLVSLSGTLTLEEERYRAGIVFLIQKFLETILRALLFKKFLILKTEQQGRDMNQLFHAKSPLETKKMRKNTENFY